MSPRSSSSAIEAEKARPIAASGIPFTSDQRLRATVSQPLVVPSPHTWFTAFTAGPKPWCSRRSSPEMAAAASIRRSATTTRALPMAGTRAAAGASAPASPEGRLQKSLMGNTL